MPMDSPDLSPVETAVDSAQRALESGDTAQALAGFLRVLELDPLHPVASFWIGKILLAAGKTESAAGYFQKVTSQSDLFIDAMIDEGIAWQKLGNAEKARNCFQKIIEFEPHFERTQLQAISQLTSANDGSSAIELCRRTLLILPSSNAIHQSLGVLLTQAKRFAEAVRAAEEWVALFPDDPAALIQLGRALLADGRTAESLAPLKHAVSTAPNNTDAWISLGLAQLQLNQWTDACGSFTCAAKLSPDQPKIHKALGDAFQKSGDLNAAIQSWRRAVELDLEFADAWQNLGFGLEQIEAMDEAVACHRRVVELQPANPHSHRILGMTLTSLRRFAEAEKSIARACELAPTDPEVRWQKFCLMAFRGEFPAAWDEMEWRFGLKLRTTPNWNFKQPQWNGESLDGKKLLLHCEQGYGDSIQMFRYVQLLADRGAQVLLWCPEPLLRLFAAQSGIANAFTKVLPSLAFDFHSPMMSLPRLFKSSLETIHCKVPYLSAPLQMTAESTMRRIGICWRGSMLQPNDKRSLKLDALKPLLAQSGIEFHSLQIDATAEERKQLAHWGCQDHFGQLIDFADTAGWIDQMDAVVSIDTAVAHLSGALGCKTWLLLSSGSDWRWLDGRTDSPWYPTATLVRQLPGEPWAAVIDRLVSQIS